MLIKDMKVKRIANYVMHLNRISKTSRSDFKEIYGLDKDEVINNIYGLISKRLK